jgi:muramidase (phage lysozyme)
MSTIKQDPCTDFILDFIAGGVPGNPSGESCGNYNAVFGNVQGITDLSKKTLSEIHNIQSYLVKRNRGSSAVGRYQFLRTTLADLQHRYGIADSALFTPELQDQLAVKLLVKRGYSSWYVDQMTDIEFAHLLSLEWASLPDPYNGSRSHYDNDVAGNHASTSLNQVYLMLRAARAARKDMERAKNERDPCYGCKCGLAADPVLVFDNAADG